MTADKLASAILNKCEIYYGEALISKERILERYLDFFSKSLITKEKSINFALHTGSKCFDVISIVAIALGCLSYNLTTNDNLISTLQNEDMVMFKGQRYRWKGIELRDGNTYLKIEQDGKGRNGKSTSFLPLENNKHLIKPYYGDSQVTDGRGVRQKNNNREDFLAYIFGVDIADVPTQVDVSVVIVTMRDVFSEICKYVTIRYSENKRVGLLDIVPASYYTNSGEIHQFGANPTKVEPVLKVTQHISIARELVLERSGNQVVGLLVTSGSTIMSNFSELDDLLRREVLRFAHVISQMDSNIGEHILSMYGDAEIFACTKEFLAQNESQIGNSNLLTMELYRQITNTVENTVTSTSVDGGWNWSEYCQLKNVLRAIQQSNIQVEHKDDFVISAYGLMNLLNTAIFTMGDMERLIETGIINQGVSSPCQRISLLWEFAENAGSLQDSFIWVADTIERKCKEFLNSTPKAKILDEYLDAYSGEEITIVVPKAYYIAVLNDIYPHLFEDKKVLCVTANRFNKHLSCNHIMVVGNISSARFDPLQCQSARNIDVLLYDCEQKIFQHNKRKIEIYEDRLNEKIGVIFKKQEITETANEIEQTLEEEIQQFLDLDEYIVSKSVFDIRMLSTVGAQDDGHAPVSEVTHIGSFSTGEQILFSKFYSAVVFDIGVATVIEKKVEDLISGDILVFVRRDDYTQNIVDYIYENLLRIGRMGQASVEAYEKSLYWKEALRDYKERKGYTYRKIASELRKLGSSLQEMTIRQWLVEDSHIVGPRDEKTMGFIAALTSDPFLISDAQGYFEACRIIRQERRTILTLIGQAINEQLRGHKPAEGSVLEIVYKNVENLAETLELDYVVALDDAVTVNSNLVNRPIAETEVFM